MFNIPIPEEMSHVAIDRNHLALIFGLVVAHKPLQVLELGIGSGDITRTITAALRYNNHGHLTSVDNCYDWGGNVPAHFPALNADRSEWVQASEAVYLRDKPDGAFDMVIADADHPSGGKMLEEHLRVVRPGGLLLIHDVCNADYPGLCEIPARITMKGMNPLVFNRSTLTGERCSRGLLVARKP